MKRKNTMLKAVVCFCIMLFLIGMANGFNATKAEETPIDILRDQEIENAFYLKIIRDIDFRYFPGQALGLMGTCLS